MKTISSSFKFVFVIVFESPPKISICSCIWVPSNKVKIISCQRAPFDPTPFLSGAFLRITIHCLTEKEATTFKLLGIYISN